MVGGVYPNAAVTLAFVRLIVPELLVILLPVLTKPNAEPVAAPYVVLLSCWVNVNVPLFNLVAVKVVPLLVIFLIALLFITLGSQKIKP